MAERAKLKFNGRSYYDADLVFICQKELKFNGLKYLSYVLDRPNDCLIAVGYVSDRDAKITIPIPFVTLSMYNVGKSLNDLVVDGKIYDDKKLMQIGNDVASLWGASCISYTIDKRKKEIVFECVEHGENFVTSLEFSELKEYKY